MSLVIECWQTLASDRPVVPFGMGGSYRGEIPHRSIRDWCRDHELDDEDLRLVAAVIRTLDADRTERIHNELTSKT